MFRSLKGCLHGHWPYSWSFGQFCMVDETFRSAWLSMICVVRIFHSTYHILSRENKMLANTQFKTWPRQTVFQFKAYNMYFLIEVILRWFCVTERRKRTDSPKWLMMLGDIFCMASTTATKLLHNVNHKRIDLKNSTRLDRYFCWLLSNFSVTFGHRKAINTCCDEGHCGWSISRNRYPSHDFSWLCLIFSAQFSCFFFTYRCLACQHRDIRH